ncbi:GNAT family N-acetyltransferase [Clostridiaceae bacterium M8S5]|nr:GNAT family N-acetyltransferase [Clostridiaceae bacterium M8S5]
MCLEYIFRKMNKEDGVFIREMCYQAIYVPPNEEAPSKDILNVPKLKKYYENIGLDSDFGIVAIEKNTMKPIGAAWLRLFDEKNQGYGFIDSIIPELSMAVDYAYRNKGMGSRLLKQLLEGCVKRYPSISLSVDQSNYAYDLYKKCGFLDMKIENKKVTMLLTRS